MTESEKSDKRVRRFFCGMFLIIVIELIITHLVGREIPWAILGCLAGFGIVGWLFSLNAKPFI